MPLTLTPPDRKNDAFLDVLERARCGDREARGTLVEQFYPQVRAIVHRSLATDLRNNRPWLLARFSTGDVVQEVFQSVLGDLDAFQGSTERSFAGYLSMLVRNRIIDAIRFHEADRRDGRRSAPGPEDGDHTSGAVAPDGEAARREQRALLFAALAELPERERLLVRARFEDTASFRELAEQLGYGSESAARRAYQTAHARLAVRLARNQPRGGEER